MKTEIAFGIIDVAGQFAEPAFAEARPQQRAHRRDNQTGDHQEFPEFVHMNYGSKKTQICQGELNPRIDTDEHG